MKGANLFLAARRDEGDALPRGYQEEEGPRHPQDHRALVNQRASRHFRSLNRPVYTLASLASQFI